jgi:hypothetical protein
MQSYKTSKKCRSPLLSGGGGDLQPQSIFAHMDIETNEMYRMHKTSVLTRNVVALRFVSLYNLEDRGDGVTNLYTRSQLFAH